MLIQQLRAHGCIEFIGVCVSGIFIALCAYVEEVPESIQLVSIKLYLNPGECRNQISKLSFIFVLYWAAQVYCASVAQPEISSNEMVRIS